MTAKKIAWFHCFSGIAGDMALGALISAGADLDEIKKTCAALQLPDWDIKTSKTQRNGIAATQVEIIYSDDSHSRNASTILELIQNAHLPQRVSQRAASIFTSLAEAEGKIHNKPPQEVHFHEVGGMDAILDIVGTCAALENLQIEEIYASPVAHGTGTISCSHGTMPNPPPAVVELLRGAPVYGVDVPYELTTPTGAAIISALAVEFCALPQIHLVSSGFGAGSREFPELPNLAQVLIGKTDSSSPLATSLDSHTPNAAANRGQPAILLETNLDDITGEILADAITQLLKKGAHDAWATPIIMKKGRPAHTLSVLADPADLPALADLLVSTTGTLGVRAQSLQRWPQPRSTKTVEVDGYMVRVKISAKSAKPEYEDLKAVASATGKSVRKVKAEVMSQLKE